MNLAQPMLTDQRMKHSNVQVVTVSDPLRSSVTHRQRPHGCEATIPQADMATKLIYYNLLRVIYMLTIKLIKLS